MTRPTAIQAEVEEVEALEVDCDVCGACVANPCRGLASNAVLPRPHPARVSVGQYNPKIASPLRRRCPVCRAAPGKPCQEGGGIIQYPHQPRYEPSMAPAAEVGIERPCPLCKAKAGQPCKDWDGNKLAKLHSTRQYPLNNPDLIPTEASTRSRDHATSRAAAKILSGKLSPLQAHISSLFRVYGKMTDEELHTRLKVDYPNMAESTGRKRRTELAQAGKLVIVGRKERPGKAPLNIYDLAERAAQPKSA